MKTGKIEIDIDDFLDRHRFTAYQLLLLLLCFAVLLSDGLDTAAMGYIAPSLLVEWGISKPEIGPVMSAALIGIGVGSLVSGPAADTWGRKKVIVAAVLVFSLASLASAFSPTLTVLTGLRLVTGIGLGAAIPNVVTLMSEYSPAPRRSLVVMVMFCGFSLGNALAGIVASVLIPAYGWRSLLIVGGVLPAITVVFVIALLPESVRFLVHRNANPERIARILRRIDSTIPNGVSFVVRASSPAASRSSVLLVVGEGRMLGTVLLWIGYLLGLFITYLLTGWLPILMKEAAIPPQAAAIATSLFMIGAMLGNPLYGWLMDKGRPHTVIGLGFCVAAVLIYLIGHYPTDISALRWLLFASGCAMSALVAMLPLAAQFYDTRCRATGLSWMLAMGRAGGILGAWIGGTLMGWGWGFEQIFSSLALLSVVAAICVALKGTCYRQTSFGHAADIKAGTPGLDAH